MKTIKLLILSILLLLASNASAGWNPTTIRFVQVDISANVVYVYFDTKIELDTCPDPSAKTIGGAILRKNQPMFEEMYARLLVAEQSNEEIQVLSSSSCSGSTYFWVDNPYIRFGN